VERSREREGGERSNERDDPVQRIACVLLLDERRELSLLCLQVAHEGSQPLLSVRTATLEEGSLERRERGQHIVCDLKHQIVGEWLGTKTYQAAVERLLGPGDPGHSLGSYATQQRPGVEDGDGWEARRQTRCGGSRDEPRARRSCTTFRPFEV